MLVTGVRLKNWRNFREAEFGLREITYVLGANATGKSNLLDLFRFLRDIAKPQGGGLQKAVADRGGISKLRCLHARRDPEIEVTLYLAPTADAPWDWGYQLAFKSEGVGAQRVLISYEIVWKRGQVPPLLRRPLAGEEADKTLLTETYLESPRTNAPFRDIANFFSGVTYLHLVPQLLKFGDRIGGYQLEDDPFGQGFLERVARASEPVRKSRLEKIQAALQNAVPKFDALEFERDKINGRPHLKARYKHHRPKAGWQREDQFSDGTLRLIGLLWSLLERDSMLLLEEPELSLNDEIVRQFPAMLDHISRGAKDKRQVLISTHSAALLSNPGIDGRGVVLLAAGEEGTIVRGPNPQEIEAMKAGFSPADVLLPKTNPEQAGQLGRWS